eukprot:TRINITY_DN740_c0_g1_i3.p2 TRINITY_DN740_c0_g1~~TRINITY_DN740_c0_g1_i3.p2  ORF type:complete len:120 (+),score=36.73 TRINITY_DN740_c0_g1_i3:64-423(+)
MCIRDSLYDEEKSKTKRFFTAFSEKAKSGAKSFINFTSKTIYHPNAYKSITTNTKESVKRNFTNICTGVSNLIGKTDQLDDKTVASNLPTNNAEQVAQEQQQDQAHDPFSLNIDGQIKF